MDYGWHGGMGDDSACRRQRRSAGPTVDEGGCGLAEGVPEMGRGGDRRSRPTGSVGYACWVRPGFGGGGGAATERRPYGRHGVRLLCEDGTWLRR
jgi:hypothetical protein